MTQNWWKPEKGSNPFILIWNLSYNHFEHHDSYSSANWNRSPKRQVPTIIFFLWSDTGTVKITSFNLVTM